MQVSAVKESAVGSEAAIRAADCVQHLSKHLSTQIMLVRADMLEAMAMAMGAGIMEATSALVTYANLSEATTDGHPPYLGQMKTPLALANIKGLCNHPKIGKEDKALAEKVYAHLTE